MVMTVEELLKRSSSSNTLGYHLHSKISKTAEFPFPFFFFFFDPVHFQRQQQLEEEVAAPAAAAAEVRQIKAQCAFFQLSDK